MSKRVLPASTSPRCKVCRHAERQRFDSFYLARYMNGELDEGGVKLTHARLAEIASIVVGEPVGERSIRRHLAHVRIVDEATAEKVEEAADESKAALGAFLERIRSGDAVDPDDALDLIVTLGVAELEAKLERDGTAGVTTDQLTRAIQAKTQRRSADAQRYLLGLMGQGLDIALRRGGVLDPATEPAGELEAGEPAEVVGEVVAEEDAGS